MRLPHFLPGLALILSALVPFPVQGQTSLAAQVRALIAQYDSAWNHRDTSAVSRLLAPEYQYFTSRGGVSSRAEAIAFLSDPEYRLERAQRSEVAVSLSGPVAVVSSRWRGQGTYRGEVFTDDQRCGQTWLRTTSVWHLLSEHCVQIVPPVPAPSNQRMQPTSARTRAPLGR